jgi:hypothetical protein
MKAACWLAFAPLLSVLAMTAGARGNNDLLVVDGLGISRLRDTNGDNDAFDPGENVSWSDQAVGANFLTRWGAGVLANDFAGPAQLLLLQDANGDGDALDMGEATPWFTDPIVPSFSDIRSSGSTVYALDSGAGDVYQLLDLNGDGDAQDVGEFSLFATGFSLVSKMDVRGAELLVADAGTGEVYSVLDRNGDGDALDAGERLLHSTPTVDFQSTILVDSANSYFVSNSSFSSLEQVTDLNGDGDGLDVAEVLTYADPTPAGIFLTGPTAAGTDGSLIAGAFQAGVSGLARVRDNNGDGDALDVAEVSPYADVPAGVLDVISVPQLVGDYNQNGVVDAADYALWRKSQGQTGIALLADGDGNNVVNQADYYVWVNNFGRTLADGSGAALVQVPEPATSLMLLSSLAALVTWRRPPSSVAHRRR